MSEAPTQGLESIAGPVDSSDLIDDPKSYWPMSQYGLNVTHCLLMLRYLYEPQEAIRWITSAQELLQARIPADLLLTREGAKEVDAMISRILDGAHI